MTQVLAPLLPKKSDIVVGDAFCERTQKILKRKILWRKICDLKISQKKFRTRIFAKKNASQVADVEETPYKRIMS